LIPFFEVPDIPVGPFQVHAFGILAAAAMGAGYFWFSRRVRQLGFNGSHVAGMVFWMLAAGFAGAIVLKFLYVPGLVQMLPTAPANIVLLGGGIASFGGLFAGLAGGCLYLHAAGLGNITILRYLDALAFVFPRAWFLGRLGCALSHDHPGVRTDSWLGVQYPGGTRYDLGLIEALFTLLFIGALEAIGRRHWPPGFYLGLFLSVYGGFRFALDFLHENALRYFGWTVDQYASTAAVAAGLALLATCVGRSGQTPTRTM